MKILEVRDSFVKIESEENVLITDLLLIEDTEKSYIAQVEMSKSSGISFFLYAKILYNFEQGLIPLDKTTPAIDSKVSKFDLGKINNISKNDIAIGSFPKKEALINIDRKNFDKNLLISIDSQQKSNILIKNCVQQFDKSIIIDTLGIINNQEKCYACKDFSLPLNTASLSFIYEDCLTDATSDSKALIKEIFRDLADYSKTVPFLPFGVLKSIVDEMVEKSHIFKLLVLKNKLAKFDKLRYFATTSEEVSNLKEILNKKHSVVDISKLDTAFQNRYLSIILSEIEQLDIKPQVFVTVSNNINKTTLKELVMGKNAITLLTHSRFKYLSELKQMYKNFIVEPTFSNNQLFKEYSSFLNRMSNDYYLVIDENNHYIPLISEVKDISSILTNEIYKELESNLNSQEKSIEIELDIEPETNNIANNSSINAINKSSEAVIERVSAEIDIEQFSPETGIFGNENENEERSEISVEDLEISENKDVEENTSTSFESNNFQTIEHSSSVSTDINTESIVEQNVKLNNIEESENLEFEEIETAPVELSIENESFEEPSIDTVDNNLLEESNVVDITSNIDNEKEETFSYTQIDEIQTIEIPEDISNLAEEAENLVIEESIPEYVESNNEISSIELDEDPSEVLPLNTDFEIIEENGDTLIELDDAEITDDVIVVEIDDEETELSREDLDKAIIEDVDKVFTTIKDESISDSDLDFIDELNNNLESNEEEFTLSEGMEELTELQELDDSEDSFLEPLEEMGETKLQDSAEKEVLETRNSSTPIVPVYDAEIPQEDQVNSDSIEQGDIVVHAKYGNGVVEKMIKYGTKTLYSINFDNVGRKLLDPILTEIKKA